MGNWQNLSRQGIRTFSLGKGESEKNLLMVFSTKGLHGDSMFVHGLRVTSHHLDLVKGPCLGLLNITKVGNTWLNVNFRVNAKFSGSF
jgi:hypothetical protein